MKIVLQDNHTYVISIRKGEEIMETLKEFCGAQSIAAGSFSCIGAVRELEVWWYDTEKKEYQKKQFEGQREITGMLGNCSVLAGETVIHAHGTFADRAYGVIGGHVGRAVVSGACEVILARLGGSVKRAYDEETGLSLMDA
jgi:uncharacterized protein